MGLRKIIANIFSGLFKSSPKPVRRRIEDVKPNEEIIIEWDAILGGVGKVRCINNDPKTKRIFVEIKWDNMIPAKQRFVAEYV